MRTVGKTMSSPNLPYVQQRLLHIWWQNHQRWLLQNCNTHHTSTQQHLHTTKQSHTEQSSRPDKMPQRLHHSLPISIRHDSTQINLPLLQHSIQTTSTHCWLLRHTLLDTCIHHLPTCHHELNTIINTTPNPEASIQSILLRVWQWQQEGRSLITTKVTCGWVAKWRLK